MTPPARLPAGAPVDPRAVDRAPDLLDTRERDRLLRAQPPTPVPERVRPQPVVGLLAASLLGARVYRGGPR